jgi:hypothetical protein
MTKVYPFTGEKSNHPRAPGRKRRMAASSSAIQSRARSHGWAGVSGGDAACALRRAAKYSINCCFSAAGKASAAVSISAKVIINNKIQHPVRPHKKRNYEKKRTRVVVGMSLQPKDLAVTFNFMNELVFEVTQEADGGFVAEALGESIFTEADTWDALRSNVREAVQAFYFDRPAPKNLRLHLVRDEVLG